MIETHKTIQLNSLVVSTTTREEFLYFDGVAVNNDSIEISG